MQIAIGRVIVVIRAVAVCAGPVGVGHLDQRAVTSCVRCGIEPGVVGQPGRAHHPHVHDDGMLLRELDRKVAHGVRIAHPGGIVIGRAGLQPVIQAEVRLLALGGVVVDAVPVVVLRQGFARRIGVQGDPVVVIARRLEAVDIALLGGEAEPAHLAAFADDHIRLRVQHKHGIFGALLRQGRAREQQQHGQQQAHGEDRPGPPDPLPSFACAVDPIAIDRHNASSVFVNIDCPSSFHIYNLLYNIR